MKLLLLQNVGHFSFAQALTKFIENYRVKCITRGLSFVFANSIFGTLHFLSRFAHRTDIQRSHGMLTRQLQAEAFRQAGHWSRI
jgi:hypothetical protein